MKRILVSVLLVSLAFAAFADDAKVLPSGVLRLTLANSMITSDSAFDADGKKQDSTEMFFDNFGAAAEFGITDKISAAIQWAPGTMLAWDIDGAPDELVFTGLADLFVGAKIQVVNDGTIRFAFAPGLAIPLDKLDFVEEFTAMSSGDDFRQSSRSVTESLGLGLRLYFDYQLTDDLYINLYNQTRYYLPNTKDVFGFTDMDYEYGIYLDFEVEPHYDLTLSKTASMGFGFPVDFSSVGETTVNDTARDDASYILAINPGISFFYTGGFPFEVAANYSIPLMGEKISMVNNVFTVKLKLFYDFY